MRAHTYCRGTEGLGRALNLMLPDTVCRVPCVSLSSSSRLYSASVNVMLERDRSLSLFVPCVPFEEREYPVPVVWDVPGRVGLSSTSSRSEIFSTPSSIDLFTRG